MNSFTKRSPIIPISDNVCVILPPSNLTKINLNLEHNLIFLQDTPLELKDTEFLTWPPRGYTYLGIFFHENDFPFSSLPVHSSFSTMLQHVSFKSHLLYLEGNILTTWKSQIENIHSSNNTTPDTSHIYHTPSIMNHPTSLSTPPKNLSIIIMQLLP